MHVVFMGSPDFAVPSLLRLAQGGQLVGVVTQPDRPAGRGRSLSPPAVKLAALDLGLPIRQPDRLRDPQFLDWLRSLSPDVIVVAAYGRILKPDILRLPRRGCINVHASLLPRWRGASPLQSALLAGDATSGVTIMVMDEGMDTGPLLAQRATPILPTDTGADLSQRLASLGADLLIETLPGWLDATLPATPQEERLATHAPLLNKADGRLDPHKTAVELARQVRAFHPWPGSFLQWGDERLTIHRARALDAPAGTPGTLLALGEEPALLTTHGALVFEEVQPAGRRPQSGPAYLRGSRGFQGAFAASP